MKIRIHETAHALALDAAADGAERIRRAIRDRGAARSRSSGVVSTS